MRELGRALARRATCWQADAILGGLTVGCLLGYQQVIGVPWSQRFPAIGFGLAFATALALRRRLPVAATAAFGVVLAALRMSGLGNAAQASLEFFAWIPFALSYSAGAAADLMPGLAATTWLASALLLQNRGFNPFLIMITAGPWLAGHIVRSRRRLVRQLEARNRELEAERERFARECVRYERAGIARELHDIVAHNLSLIVVQAGAGQRASGTGNGAAAALHAIAEAADSAQAEMGRLTGLLGQEPPAGDSPRLKALDELVRRTRAAGLNVTARTPLAADRLAPGASQAAYRVIQEALTNAMRHAPGAGVDVTINEAADGVAIRIENGPPNGNGPGPDLRGAGRGLAGLKDRASACGGFLTAGPTSSGGWLVRVEVPARRAGGA
jgi:signal transduction histidine kinase